jgi:hypothetical protein
MNKLTEIQHRLKAPKGQYNSFGKYKFRSCEDILEAVKPILVEVDCTLTLSDEIALIGDRYYVKAIAHLTGEGVNEVVSAYAREDEEKKGMDGPQITGTASSYARKYALNGLFCIDDTKDADTDEYANQNKKASPSQPSKPKETTKELMHPGHEKWQTMLQSIIDGKCTLEKVKSKYRLLEEDEFKAKEWLLTHQN